MFLHFIILTNFYMISFLQTCTHITFLKYLFFIFQWDPERLIPETLFVMGARANK